MKKVVSAIRLLFLTILVLLASSTVYATDGRIVSFNNDKIAVFQQLDYMRVKTSKGNVISELETRTQIDTETVAHRESTNVDVCFILDKSGSMKNKRLSILKEAVIKLIENLRTNFDDKSKLRISAVTFSNNNATLFNLTECTDENLPDMRDKINNISAGGNTYTVSAINYAKTQIWDRTLPDDTIRYTVLITDGEASANIDKVNDTINSIKNSASTGFFTVFCGEDKTVNNGRGGRSKLSELYSASDELIFCSDEKFEETITVEVFRFITERYVNIKSLKTETLQAYNAKVLDENSIEAEIDDELLNGATLELEYSFNIVTTEEIEEISIENYLSGLGFDKEAKLITANEMNSTYGWNQTSDTVVITTFSPIMEKEENGDYKRIVVKLLLSKVVAIGTDITDQMNEADIKIKTKNGVIYQTKELTSSTAGQEIIVPTGILSPSITITSPMGHNSYAWDIALIICTLILLTGILNIKGNNICPRKH